MAAALQRAGAAAAVAARCAAPAARSMSVLASFPYWQKEHPDTMVMQNRNGMNVDVNYSLLPDGIVPGGDVWRNAQTQALLMYSSGKVTKSRAVVSNIPAKAVPMFATDEYPGMKVMDVGDFEDLTEQVKDHLYSSKRMFVHDGVIGADRDTQTRVRVVTDSPDIALFASNMLHTTPLYNPESFPRNILVVANTAWDAAAPVVASDINPDSDTSVKATVVAAGPVTLESLWQAMGHCAAQLAHIPGWQGVIGGGGPAHNAEAAGVRSLFVPDKHWRPSSKGALDAVHVTATAVAGPKGGVALIVSPDAATAAMAGSMAPAPAASKGKGKGGKKAAAAAAPSGVTLLGAHQVVWLPTGIAPAFAGAAVDAKAVGGADALPRGSVQVASEACVGTQAPLVSAHPVQIITVGDASASDSMTTEAADAYKARVASSKAKEVSAKTVQEALKMVAAL